jgi:uncharacterized membrane protein YdjX (TVP38/TMEM64 family)
MGGLVGQSPVNHTNTSDNAVLTSHPPLFGSATTLTLIGYTWGIWPGFLIAGIAILTGSIITFLSVRVRNDARAPEYQLT